MHIDVQAHTSEIARALRLIARGFEDLAAAVAGDVSPESERVAAVLREWGDRGLTRSEASSLFRKHGFVPQTAGGWARGDWIKTRSDGLRYVTERSREWLAEQEADHD
jgi:hypothetical protein